MSKTRHLAGFTWVKTPSEVLTPAVQAYGERVKAAVFAVAVYVAQAILNYAKQYAAWTDRTANARNALHVIVVAGDGKAQRIEGTVSPEAEAIVQVAAHLVVIFLSHGMWYGKYLETISAGAWAIIMPALQAHYGQVMRMLREIFD
jgi:hypothetical protein